MDDDAVETVVYRKPMPISRRWWVFLALASAAAAQTKPPVREDIEWLDVWLPNTNSHDLPRVLLIGDSITRGYGPQVEADLKGKAYVGRMATSKSLGDPVLLDEVALVLQEQAFDVIHFNNGMHGSGYSEEEYAAALPALLATLRRYAPHARLIWASTTDVRQRDRLETVDTKTERIVQRNRAAAEIVQRENIPIDDLFSLVRGHPDYHAQDGMHFSDKGSEILAAQVSESIARLLR
jgi:lysophospholipase L1-like esterase